LRKSRIGERRMGVAGFVGFSLFWKVFVLLFGVFVDEVWRPACAVLLNEDRSTKIRPSLTVMVLEAP